MGFNSGFKGLRNACRGFVVATRNLKDVILTQFLSNYCLLAPDTYSVTNM